MDAASFPKNRNSGCVVALLTVVIVAVGMRPAVAAARTSEPPPVQVATLPLAGASLNGVSCPSARLCFAVGAVEMIGASGPQSSALIERFDGRGWRVSLRLGNTVSALSAISCVSTSFCLAVGYDGSYPAPTLAMRWNGRSWSRVGSASPPSGGEGDDLSGVSCLSARVCWAVGGANIDLIGTVPSSLIERFDGRALHIVSAPDAQAALSMVGCPSSSSCYASGDRGSLESLRGSDWRLGPQPGSFDTNGEAITCATTATCWLLASNASDDGLDAFRLVRGQFRVARVQPTGSGVIPYGSDCADPTDCWAVGSSMTTSPTPVPPPTFSPIAEQWNGSRWMAARTRSSYDGEGELSAVSCRPSGLCVAVGHSLLDADTTALVAVMR